MQSRNRTWLMNSDPAGRCRQRTLQMTSGVSAPVSVDFLQTGAVDSRFSFTRATTGTYINSLGYVQSAAIDVPRFDFDPTTRICRGLLVEADAQNDVRHSETFRTSAVGSEQFWNDTSITRNSTTATSPRNDATALQVTSTAGNATIIASAQVGSISTRTFSIWLRRVSGSGNIEYTMNNGTLWTTQAITSTWTRYTLATTSANHRVGIRIVTSGDSIELWGAQLEPGTGSSSYIPTTTSAGTRSADFLVMSDITAANFNTVAGTIYAEWIYTKRDNAISFPLGVGFMTATDSPGPVLQQFTNSTNAFGSARGTSIVSLEKSAAYSLNVVSKIAVSATTSTTPLSLGLAINGTASSDTDAGTGPMYTPTRFVVSRPSYGQYLASGCLRTIRYWPWFMSQSEIANMTS